LPQKGTQGRKREGVTRSVLEKYFVPFVPFCGHFFWFFCGYAPISEILCAVCLFVATSFVPFCGY
jgi:hypothetical protein